MSGTARRPLSLAAWTALAVPVVLAAAPHPGPEVAATRSLTVQPAGVRGGKAGAEYLNVEGKGNGKYASYGLLTFPALGAGAGERSGKVEGLTLTLVQSIPKFARDGKVRFFLVDPGRIEPEGLKFDESSPGGLGDRFGDRQPVGTGAFKKVETGHADTFALALDEPARKLLGRRPEGQGEIHLLIVPDDDGVAATYFGAGEEDAGRRPRLALKVAAP